MIVLSVLTILFLLSVAAEIALACEKRRRGLPTRAELRREKIGRAAKIQAARTLGERRGSHHGSALSRHSITT